MMPTRATAEQVDDFFWALLSSDWQERHMARNGGQRKVCECFAFLSTFDPDRCVRVTAQPPYETPFQVGDVLHAPIYRSPYYGGPVPRPGDPHLWYVWVGGALWILAPWEGQEVDSEHLSDYLENPCNQS
jgi:hypothetical protein